MEPLGEVNMATVTLKNIPDELYKKLKKTAEINRRSINSEIIVCIEHGVSSRRINPEEILANARRLRELTEKHPITIDQFNQAKAQGRL
jgi:antitoxin FitA